MPRASHEHYQRLGLDRSALNRLQPKEAEAVVDAVSRSLRKTVHPDAPGGDHQRFVELELAVKAVEGDFRQRPSTNEALEALLRDPDYRQLPRAEQHAIFTSTVAQAIAEEHQLMAAEILDHLDNREVVTEPRPEPSPSPSAVLPARIAELRAKVEDLEFLLQQRVEDGLLTHLRRPYQIGLRLVGGAHVEASISRIRREVTLPEVASAFGPGPFVVLGWLEDESTSAPRSVRGDGGDPYRLFRLTALQGRFHKLALEPEVGRWLVVLDRSAQHQMERFRFLGRVTRI